MKTLVPHYLRGTCSKVSGTCMKPWLVPNPTCTMIKFSLPIRHNRRLATITKNEIEQLHPYCNESYVSVLSPSLFLFSQNTVIFSDWTRWRLIKTMGSEKADKRGQWRE